MTKSGWLANAKQNVKKETHRCGENFEAVVSFKLYCDNQDNLFIYKVNDRCGNPDLSFFVFIKSSRERMKIALSMDREGDHFTAISMARLKDVTISNFDRKHVPSHS